MQTIDRRDLTYADPFELLPSVRLLLLTLHKNPVPYLTTLHSIPPLDSSSYIQSYDASINVVLAFLLWFLFPRHVIAGTDLLVSCVPVLASRRCYEWYPRRISPTSSHLLTKNHSTHHDQTKNPNRRVNSVEPTKPSRHVSQANP